MRAPEAADQASVSLYLRVSTHPSIRRPTARWATCISTPATHDMSAAARATAPPHSAVSSECTPNSTNSTPPHTCRRRPRVSRPSEHRCSTRAHTQPHAHALWPRTATARSEIMLAMPRPPATAAPVQTAWPRQPPSVTPTTLLLAARPMVAIWLRSPHSARKVSVNTSTSTGDSSPARAQPRRKASGKRTGRMWKRGLHA